MVRLSLQILGLLALILALAPASRRETASGSSDDTPKKDGGKDKDPTGFGGRTGAGKARLLKEFGGSEASEEAVMLGLAWLTQTQQPDGSWKFVYSGSDPTIDIVLSTGYKQSMPRASVTESTKDSAGATGLALLSFLGAGQSHKAGRYQKTVQAGLDWLVKNVSTQAADKGKFQGTFNGGIYGQGIATLALCEAYGLTQDKAILPAAQAAIDYIQNAQAVNGSWGYAFKGPGDTSIVGWQIQALHAASLTQDISVKKSVIDKAVGFLNSNATGKNKAIYGYNDASDWLRGPGTSLTAIGLLLRYYIDGWRADHPGFEEGVKGLMPLAPNLQNKPFFDMYFYYYATQVVRFHGKDEWLTWNEGPKGPDGSRKGGMQDWLISLQDRSPTHRGSWPPDVGIIGPWCGRLGTTAFCLLTLEVYYRYSPENANDPKK